MDAHTFDRLVADAARRPTRRTALRLLAGGLASALLPTRIARAQRSDRDGDGLFDDDETDVYGTNPDLSDTDGDGPDDGQEVFDGTNPLVNENAAPPPAATCTGEATIGIGGACPFHIACCGFDTANVLCCGAIMPGVCTDVSTSGGICPDLGGPAAGCPAGQTDCGGVCTDLTSDASNCGACGVLCPAGATCTAGVCECRSVLTNCNGACIDTTNDEDNCGACGKKCGTRTNGARLGCTNGLCALGF